ncbi:MAG: DUF4143 domain-containing protein [Runella slithyformis]|nr:MAG: DUF4143 domain-containing protein [Runella slithyformis]TAF01256.1 MAG: DUF4143 domain-containing protein [Runella slithyformis]TAF47785.1 MAG: DUF4143 domain-containing protein [Runella slithyformis]TAG16164.1 MAG: DUF4143 domain-containing protein [Cytophagales bacterium]TAG77314.1 MAG: DUF4143 domain-containing protein [Cytophagales bacterium]
MFQRAILKELNNWAVKPNRKPLVLRGARQVGKTTVVNAFAQQFKQYIYLNLDLPDDRQPFENFRSIDTLLQTLFFNKNQLLSDKSSTLVFIDEIQAVPQALQLLRYFYESVPEMVVIAAGSMLESLFDKHISFPVGRVEYKVVRPASFLEFLGAMNEHGVLEQLQKIPTEAFAHTKTMGLFHQYALTGGMPEVVQHYSQHKDFTALSPIYNALLASYSDDIEKYAHTNSQIQHVRHAMNAAFGQAGKRIKFEGFGNSSYKSREMGEALRTLEKALLLQLVYPETGAVLPLNPDLKRAPRLQVLDTGLMNYVAGIRKDILSTTDLNSVCQGTMIEHLVGQELLSVQYLALDRLHFWVREKNSSTAEIDYLHPYQGKLIPVEVKSGTDGRLKSLHQFMDLSPHAHAVRFYAGELSITQSISTHGKPYQLLNLPYYLATQLDRYLDWFIGPKQ